MPTNIQAQNVQYQPRAGLSPEAKSTLMTGAMASVLGATWLAPTKAGSAYNLLTLPDDKFESSVKKIAALKNETEEKQALEFLRNIRSELSDRHIKQTENLFGSANEINAKDIFKKADSRITSLKRAEIASNMLSEYNNRIALLGFSMANSDVTKKGITEDTYKIIDKIIPNNGKTTLGRFKQAFKNEFPIGITPTEEQLQTFFDGYLTKYSSKHNEILALQRVANCAGENGVITRANAEKAFKQHNLDTALDKAKEAFETMRSKLPKSRIKSAAKWFGYGIGIAVLSNIVFGILGSLFNKKK